MTGSLPLALAPMVLMALAAILSRALRLDAAASWRAFQALSALALLAALAAAWAGPQGLTPSWAWRATPLGLGLALLVQLLGAVIGAFSQRYLEGEAGQRRYVASLAGVLASVQLLLLADHWVTLIAAWAAAGWELERLLCFYPERPFARLAAHKKAMADRAADALLAASAALAWVSTGSGSLAALGQRLGPGGLPVPLQLCALGLALAVALRTAQLPAHGWLTQVMEAPTPVSALLHAGVVNLGGFVLIRFAPLLQRALPARALLAAVGLGTTVLAGLVMLTRVSVKVRLAWSTVAQMGFMVLECALGLYTLAALHLIGHSLYKAHSFLASSSAVREARRQALRPPAPAPAASLALGPAASLALVALLARAWGAAWPWWWSVVLGLAWAPLLWIRAERGDRRAQGRQALAGLAMVAALTGATRLGQALPLGLVDAPHPLLGLGAAAGLAGLYLCLAVLQRRPQALAGWRRWCYAGFYLDEAYTRLALQLWPGRWAPEAQTQAKEAA